MATFVDGEVAKIIKGKNRSPNSHGLFVQYFAKQRKSPTSAMSKIDDAYHELIKKGELSLSPKEHEQLIKFLYEHIFRKHCIKQTTLYTCKRCGWKSESVPETFDKVRVDRCVKCACTRVLRKGNDRSISNSTLKPLRQSRLYSNPI